MGTETSDFGSALPLEGQPDVLLRIANEDTCVVPGEPLSSTVVHRVLLTGAHMYRDVAWVVDADAKICMSCHKKRFGMFTWKHHCRLCGNIV